MKKKQLRILLAPLDWGLGHVTRCLPLIKHITFLGHKIIFAGNESQCTHAQSVFPELDCLPLEGYNVRYARTRHSLMPKIIAQVPRIKKSIRKEHLWLQETIRRHQIDGVISDNRYGLYSSQVPCVILTHQLQVRSGIGHYADQLLRKVHYRFLEKFNACWVVDTQEDGLAGSLSHPGKLPKIPTRYIGLLSQCAGKPQGRQDNSQPYILILLSGAEPQRSILADLLWKKALKSDQHIVFVAGSEDADTPSIVPGHISFHKKLSAEHLLIAIRGATMVICRSGYSSVMDLIALKKKAILIPTPGQTEQEYLATQLQQRRIAMKADQDKFDIHTSLINASLFAFTQEDFSTRFVQFRDVLENWLDAIAKGAKTA